MKTFLVAVMMALVPMTGVGGGFSKVGTAAAQFLKIGIGARSVGMGEAFAAVATDVSALYWNPAGITNISAISMGFSHSQWLGELSHNYAGVVVPLGASDGLGISVISMGTDEQEVTTVDQPDGTGIYYTVRDLAIGVSYARALTDRFSVGITGKYIQQDAFNESANTMAIDIGTHLKTGFHNLVIAMCVSNFGGNMQLEGRDLIVLADVNKTIGSEYNPDARLKTEAWSLPLNFRVGVSLDLIGAADAVIPLESNRLTLAMDGNHPNDNNERLNVGGEYAWDETFFARMGYKSNYDVESWTFGAGVRVNAGSEQIVFDYALVDYNDLGKVSRFSLELRF